MEASPEQKAIIMQSQEIGPGQIMKVDACAGSGKTSTLVAVTLANPEKRFLYLAFNRSIADKAGEVFPQNTKAMTMHSLAYRHVFRGAKQRPFLGNIKIDMLRRYFSTMNMMKLVLLQNEYKQFLNSPAMEFPNNKVKRIFHLIEEGKLPMSHDHYLKLYQMLTKEERGLDRDYDCILVDESQDCNPVTLSIVNTSGCSRIFVGDSHQSIYGFRGAINALASQQADRTLHLTNSFRSLLPILDQANRYMEAFHELIYKGKVPYYPMKSMLDEKRVKNEQTGIITRKNATLVAVIDRFSDVPEQAYLIKKPEEIFRLPIAMYEFLFKRKRNFTKDLAYLNQFQDKKGLTEYANEANDVEILTSIQIAEQYKKRLYDLEEIAAEMCDPDAQYVLTNAHTSKGLEWRKVILENDFPDLGKSYAKCLVENDGKIQAKDFVSTQDSVFYDFLQELNLYYVAITRAQISLENHTENAMYQSIEEIKQHADEEVRIAQDDAAMKKFMSRGR